MCYLPYCPSSKRDNGCGFVPYLGRGKGHIWPNLSDPLGCTHGALVVHLWEERLCICAKKRVKREFKKPENADALLPCVLYDTANCAFVGGPPVSVFVKKKSQKKG
jgi:hypothetical protein